MSAGRDEGDGGKGKGKGKGRGEEVPRDEGGEERQRVGKQRLSTSKPKGGDARHLSFPQPRFAVLPEDRADALSSLCASLLVAAVLACCFGASFGVRALIAGGASVLVVICTAR